MVSREKYVRTISQKSRKLIGWCTQLTHKLMVEGGGQWRGVLLHIPESEK